jgi:hypothetical protein
MGHDNKTVYFNCPICYTKKRISKCPHNDKERSFFVSCTCPEAVYALQKGYKINHIFEAIIFNSTRPIFREYMTHLLKEKICYSSPPSHINISSYCDEASKRLQLSPVKAILPSHISPNKGLRFISKLAANALVGKMTPKNKRSYTKFLRSQTELEKLYFSTSTRVRNVKAHGDICEVLLENVKAVVNRNCNSVVSAYTMGLARIELDRRGDFLESLGAKIFVEVSCIIIINSLYHIQCIE